MKKLFCLMLALCLLMTSQAFALNYYNRLGNEPTFETMGEARVNGPLTLGASYGSHPVLDGYPEDTTFIYRSANMFSGNRAAVRMNTAILVFAEEKFADKDAAYAYIVDLGLVDIINEATGSIVLVTPEDGEAFGEADAENYYALQTAICSLNVKGEVDGQTKTFAEATYYGSFATIYVIGIEGGATFLNNYVAPTFDYISRIAGMLLIGGTMGEVEVAHIVPVYMADYDMVTAANYMQINDVTALEMSDKGDTWYNQEFPLQKVVLAAAGKTNAEYVHDAYYDMFIKAMRIPVVKAGVYTEGTPYSGYSGDQAPYALCDRNAVIDGKTADGIYVVEHFEDRFAYTAGANGEYIQYWVEFLPEEVLDGTAPDHSIPLVVTNHGGGDDPWQFVDENGWLKIAGDERLALVAGEHQSIGDLRYTALPLLAEYMLETYPALDPSRVYVTGYSMGGGATWYSVSGNASLFAAAVPMAAGSWLADGSTIVKHENVDLPIMLTTSMYDMVVAIDADTHQITESYQNHLNMQLATYGMEPLTFDFETYPYLGFRGTRQVVKKLNNEHMNITSFVENEDGVPMLAVSYTEDTIHALYPEYAKLAWDFMKHYSRDPETKVISYNAYVK